MFNAVKEKLTLSRTQVFAAGLAVGGIATVVVLRNRIIWDTNNITLAGDTGLLNWLVENKNVIDFELPSGQVLTLSPS